MLQWLTVSGVTFLSISRSSLHNLCCRWIFCTNMQTINPGSFKYYKQTTSRFELQWCEMITSARVVLCVCFSYKGQMKMSWCFFKCDSDCWKLNCFPQCETFVTVNNVTILCVHPAPFYPNKPGEMQLWNSELSYVLYKRWGKISTSHTQPV